MTDVELELYRRPEIEALEKCRVLCRTMCEAAAPIWHLGMGAAPVWSGIAVGS